MYHIPVDKDYILRRVSQEQIFERYLHIKVQFDHLFRSPLRRDNNPTCGFKYSTSGVLYMRDFSGHFWGNCFDLVMYLNNLGFQESLNKIANDFGLSSMPVRSEERSLTETSLITRSASRIQIRVRNYTIEDMNYWLDFGIGAPTLKAYNVYPVEMAYVNERLAYRYSKDDPCYAYRYEEGEYKLYFPFRGRNDNRPRFLTNTSRLQGYTQLPNTGQLLIITKSYKDVMLFRTFGLNAVAPASETAGMGEEVLEELKIRFRYIVVIYDFDYAGIRYANHLRKQIGCLALFLTNGRFGTKDYGAKDPTDYYKANGKGKFHALLLEMIRYVIEKNRNT